MVNLVKNANFVFNKDIIHHKIKKVKDFNIIGQKNSDSLDIRAEKC